MAALSAKQVFWIGAALATAVQLWVGLQPLVYLDRVFLTDDSYQILSLARMIASGNWQSSPAPVSRPCFHFC